MNQEQIIFLIEEELKITQLAIDKSPDNERIYRVGMAQIAAYELILGKIKSASRAYV